MSALDDRSPWPMNEEAREAGCTCEWWGRGFIIIFDRDCPVLARHRVPEDANWRNEMVPS